MLRYLCIFPLVKLGEPGLHLPSFPTSVILFRHHHLPAIHNIFPNYSNLYLPWSFLTSQKNISDIFSLQNPLHLGKRSWHKDDLIHYYSSLCNSASATLVSLWFLEYAQHVRALHWLFYLPELLCSKVSTLPNSSPPPGLRPNVTYLVKRSLTILFKHVNLCQAALAMVPSDPCLLGFILLWNSPSLRAGWNKWLISNQQNMAKLRGCHVQD